MIDNINDEHTFFRKKSKIVTIGIFFQGAFQYSMTNKEYVLLSTIITQ